MSKETKEKEYKLMPWDNIELTRLHQTVFFPLMNPEVELEEEVDVQLEGLKLKALKRKNEYGLWLVVRHETFIFAETLKGKSDIQDRVKNYIKSRKQ